MKKKIISFILACLVSSSVNLIYGESKKPYVTLKMQNKEILKILDEISQQTKIMFIYSEDVKGKTSINVINTNIFRILPEILEPLGYNWGHIDSHYYIECGFDDGYYITKAKTKYIDPRLLKDGKEWPDTLTKEQLRGLKNQSADNEFEIEIFQKIQLKKMKEKDIKKSKEREKRKQIENEELLKAGEIIDPASVYFYSENDYKGKLSKPVIKRMEKEKKIKKIKYKHKGASVGFVDENDNLSVELVDYLSSSYDRLYCKGIVVYNKQGKIINKEIYAESNTSLMVSEKGTYYMVFKYGNNNSSAKYVLKEKSGKVIFETNMIIGEGRGDLRFFQELSLFDSGESYGTWYDFNGKQIATLKTENLGMTFSDMSDNRKYLFFLAGFSRIYCYSNSKEIYNKYILNDMSSFGLISDNGNIYISGHTFGAKDDKNIAGSSILCIDKNHKLIWQWHGNMGSRRFNLVNNDKYIFIFTRDGFVYLIDSINGQLIKSFDFNDELAKDQMQKFLAMDLTKFDKNSILSSEKLIFLCIKEGFYVFDYDLNILDKVFLNKDDGSIIRYILKGNNLYIISDKGIIKFAY